MSASLQPIDSWSAFKYHYLLWRFSGINPPEDGSYRRSYLIYALALNFYACFLFQLTQIIQIFYATDYLELAENVYILIPDAFCVMKFIYTWYTRELLLSVRPIFAQLDRRAQSQADRRAVASGIKTAHRGIIWLMRLYLCATLNNIPIALISNKRRLIIPAWFPWNWQHSREKYVATYALQLFGFLTNAVQDIGNDSYPHAFLTMVAAHMRALAVRIELIGQRATRRRYDMTPERLAAAQELAYQELVACIEDHRIILIVLMTINRTISLSCFFQFINTAVGACAMGVYCTLFEMNFTNLFNLSIFFFAICSETFILCYSGDVVCTACDELTHAIYACNWTEQHTKFRRSLLMLLRRSQKLNYILAGGFIPVRIPTFVMVMKVAYSMFTVLVR